ncbi:MAG TPA: response regulator transcription factor [Trichocoleus sp.]
MRILVVEDDNQLADSLIEALVVQRYSVDLVKDGESAWNKTQVFAYDLILMDVTLPKLDGIRLCERLRNHGCHAPVLMLTARDTSLDKVIGLDAGADAYMVKPFNLQELLAQIRALLRRGQSGASPVLSWGDLSLDPASYEVMYGRSPIRLTPKEFALMESLLRYGKRVLSRATIMERVWTWQELPEEDTIKTYIKNLRAKLQAAGAPKDLIQTVHGIGYRLKTLEKQSEAAIIR